MNSHPPPQRPAYDSTDDSDVEQTPPANAADVSDEEIARSVSHLVIQRGDNGDGRARSREGYGFRPVLSPGVATPTGSSTLASGNGDDEVRSPSIIPDVNGLGWPGKLRSVPCLLIDPRTLEWGFSIRSCRCVHTAAARKTFPLEHPGIDETGEHRRQRPSIFPPSYCIPLVSFDPACSLTDSILTTLAKLTLSRLNEPAAERKAREQKLAAAVRVILEGIGEDPTREGLLKTPERFAQALLWMTKGYEERLSGAFCIAFLDRPQTAR